MAFPTANWSLLITGTLVQGVFSRPAELARGKVGVIAEPAGSATLGFAKGPRAATDFFLAATTGAGGGGAAADFAIGETKP